MTSHLPAEACEVPGCERFPKCLDSDVPLELNTDLLLVVHVDDRPVSPNSEDPRETVCLSTLTSQVLE